MDRTRGRPIPRHRTSLILVSVVKSTHADATANGFSEFLSATVTRYAGPTKPLRYREEPERARRPLLATIRYGLERFPATGRRDVIFIGSTSALTPTASFGIYSAAKRGLHAAADSLRREIALRGINVTLT